MVRTEIILYPAVTYALIETLLMFTPHSAVSLVKYVQLDGLLSSPLPSEAVPRLRKD